MWIEFNENPAGRRVGDCAVRAIQVALGISWERAYAMIAEAGFRMCDMPSSNSVWGAVLRQHGFFRNTVPNTCPECYTAEEFCRDYPKGIYVLGFDGHVATVKDGMLYDAWDSSKEIPQLMWFRKDGN